MKIERKHRCKLPGPIARWWNSVKPGDVVVCEGCGIRWERIAAYAGTDHPRGIARDRGFHVSGGYREWGETWLAVSAVTPKPCPACAIYQTDLARLRAEIAGYR